MGLLAQMYVNFIEAFYYVVHDTEWNENPAWFHAGEEDSSTLCLRSGLHVLS